MTGDVRQAVERIRSHRDAVAERVTDAFLARHPDWVARYGDRARRFGVEDARYHLDFLAGAVLARSRDSFAEYVAWTARVLETRGIAPSFLAENLAQLEEALAEVLDPEAHALAREYLAEGRRVCGTVAGATPPEVEDAEAVTVYLGAALLGDRRAAWKVIEETMASGRSVPWIYESLIQRAQHRVGRLWEANAVTVAQEHTATAVTHYVLARLYDLLPRPDHLRGSAVVTGVGGELHGLGGQMVADALEMDGWRVRYLGTGMPHTGIVDAVEEIGGGVLAVSVTMLFNLPEARELIERVRRTRGDDAPRVLVGGGAFRTSPEAWREVGADALGRDMGEAAALARSAAPRSGA